MAYYKKVISNKEKTDYASKVSWDEEGSHYRGMSDKKKASFNNHRSSVKTLKSISGEKNSSEKDHGKSIRKPVHKSGIHSTFNKSKPDYMNYGSAKINNHFEKQKIDEYSRTDFQTYSAYEYRREPENIDESEKNERILCGRNPIREALRSGREIEKILVQKGEITGSAKEIIHEARARKVMVQEVDKRKMDEIAGHHQGLIAFASAYKYAEVQDILDLAKDKGEAPFLIILDSVTDPHNLGAIIRTAECVGAHGIIIPIHRSVGLTPAAIKASAGAIEYIKVAKVVNLNRTIEDLKQQGIWTYAVTMDGKDYEKIDFRGGTALVIGSEGNGISKLTEEKCDLSVSLPMHGHLDSLNASVAAGIIMYRVLSCRNK